LRRIMSASTSCSVRATAYASVGGLDRLSGSYAYSALATVDAVGRRDREAWEHAVLAQIHLHPVFEIEVH
jgi:hypothetical protein